ncbi:sperm-associated antigen 16 protein isoform X3 [Hydra vulgaris]|uniref:Sperm-associated antigen 16 protein isoform X3 n=2 Tax=Hydra vulgaris TaxID=6087 RepID=A0ABM4CT80_HYDVU
MAQCDTVYLTEAFLEPDSDDEFHYDKISIEDNLSLDASLTDEDFDTAVKIVKENESVPLIQNQTDEVLSKTQKRHEVPEDYVRNFLVRFNMKKTLDCFQTEWYEFKEKGLLKEEDCSNVPDIYSRNRQLDELVNSLSKELKNYKDLTNKAKDIHLKLRKERDFHRLHHKRIVQEKEKLLSDIKRLKEHYDSYEPLLKSLQQKYETAMREKMLTKLERDRAVNQIEIFQSVTKHQTSNKDQDTSILKLVSPTKELKISPKKHPKDSDWPSDKGFSPLLSNKSSECLQSRKTVEFHLINSFKAHSLAVSGISLHPHKQILATVSDDQTWKLWLIPDGENIRTGIGHSGWISHCDFNPQGSHLATTSSDTTIKIWNFSIEKYVLSFDEHKDVVWGCSWHSAGDFLASCSMDGTSKIWDVNSVRCRSTLRGHTESVNSIQFLPFSNILCTSSVDKTISLWDLRTKLRESTFYGHLYPINYATFNIQGDKIASCDAYGILKLWDVRSMSTIVTCDFGPHPMNRVVFDPDALVIAAASNDGTLRIYTINNGEVMTVSGHDSASQTVIFSLSGEYLISGGSDFMVKIWS